VVHSKYSLENREAVWGGGDRPRLEDNNRERGREVGGEAYEKYSKNLPNIFTASLHFKLTL